MSDNAITLVELDVPLETAAIRATAVASWLIDQGIVERNPGPTFESPSTLVPGPGIQRVAPNTQLPKSAGNNGVDVIQKRKLHHPIGNYEPPLCPRCGVPIDVDVHQGLIEEWLLTSEPRVTCSQCGQTNLIGDWPGDFTFFVGNLAVRFNNWWPLTDEFTNDLGSRLGTRWRVVFEHL